MNRLFTFGCSFTQYNWAMWPEIVKFEHKPKKFYNYGRPGAGNRYIAHQVSLANLNHKFTPDDMVMICWTHFYRNDWFVPDIRNDEDGGWETMGNAYNPHGLNKMLPEDSNIESNMLSRDLNYIYLTISMLNNLNISNHQLQIVDLTSGDSVVNLDEKKLTHNEISPFVEFCKQHIADPYVDIVNVWPDWFSEFPGDQESKRCDYHPMPMGHIHYLETALEMSISDETKEVAQRCQDSVFEYIRKERKHYPEDHGDFNKLFEDDTGEYKFMDNFK